MNRRKFLEILSVVIPIAGVTAAINPFIPKDDSPWLQSQLDAGNPVIGQHLLLRTRVIARKNGAVLEYNEIHFASQGHIDLSKITGYSVRFNHFQPAEEPFRGFLGWTKYSQRMLSV